MENKISAIAFISGIACIITAIIAGEVKAGIFIVFPFIYGNGPLMIVGVLLIFLSLLLLIFSQFHFESEAYPGKRAGGLILIGPIPIVVSSDKKLALILVAIGIAIIFFFVFFHLIF